MRAAAPHLEEGKEHNGRAGGECRNDFIWETNRDPQHWFFHMHWLHTGFPGGTVVKNLPVSARDIRDAGSVRKTPWRRKWQPASVFLPGKSHGQRSLVGYSLWGHKESDTTEHTHLHQPVRFFPCLLISPAPQCQGIAEPPGCFPGNRAWVRFSRRWLARSALMKHLRGREGSRTDPGQDAKRGGLPGPSGSPGVRTALQKALHWEGAGLSHPCTSQWWPASPPSSSPWGDCLRLSAGLWGRSLGDGYTSPEMRVWQDTNSTCYRALPPPHFPLFFLSYKAPH